jgi:hypothetical protein
MSSGDLLLYVISARSELSWSVYKSVFDTLASKEQLQYENVGVARAICAWNLDALAFCEFFGGSSDRKLTSVPTHLVRLPTVQPKAVLTGARAISTLEHISAICREFSIHISAEEQEGEIAHLCPSRFELTAERDDCFHQFAERAGITFSEVPAAWSLAHTSGGLDEIVERLSWQEVPELTWPRMDFDINRCHFRSAPDKLRNKVRLTRYKDPKRGTVRYCVWNERLSAQIDPDWGRYFVLRHANKNVFYCDEKKNLLLLPKTLKLPRLLNRAVALCSGILPKLLPAAMVANTCNYIAYEFVPELLASTIARKVGQNIQKTTIAVPS